MLANSRFGLSIRNHVFAQTCTRQLDLDACTNTMSFSSYLESRLVKIEIIQIVTTISEAIP